MEDGIRLKGLQDGGYHHAQGRGPVLLLAVLFSGALSMWMGG